MLITNIRCQNAGAKIRVIFDWPVGVEKVIISGRLFTLREYKQLGGFHAEKKPGVTEFVIHPVGQEEQVAVGIFVEKTKVNYIQRKKRGLGFELTLLANYPVPAEKICYVKKKNTLPVDITDGKLYYFDEEIETGQAFSRIIQTDSDEFIRVFSCCPLHDVIAVK